MERMWHLMGALCLGAALAACGGGGGGGNDAGPQTVGASGGTVRGPDGLSVRIDADALAADVTVALAADSGGAPPLPAGVQATGAIYAATPHGIGFARPARLRVPFDPAAFAAPGDRPTLLTAAPGGDWVVLGGARRDGDSLVVDVTSFSYYTVINCAPTCQSLPLDATVRLALDEEDPARTGPHLDRAEATFRTPRYVPATLSFTSPGDITSAFAYRIFFTSREGRREVAAGRLGTSPMRLELPVLEADNGYKALQVELSCARTTFDGRCYGTTGATGVQAFTVRLLGSQFVVDIPPGTPVTALLPLPTEQPQDLQVEPAATSLPFGVAVAQTGVTHFWEVSRDGGSTWTDLGSYPVRFDSWVVPFEGERFARAVAEPVLRSTLDYRWDYSFLPPTGAPRLVDASLNGLKFRARLVNAYGQRYSRVATLTIAAAVAPAIAQQPQSAAVAEGQGASFTVVASGTPAPAFRWQWRAAGASAWTDVAGQTRSTYATGPLALASNGAQVRVVVSNTAGSVTSEAATVSVTSTPVPPSVVTSPQPLTIAAGGTALFATAVSGTGPLSYQWLRNGVAIPGANTPLLRLDAVPLDASGGSFRLRVSNAVGMVESGAAVLTVVPAEGGAPLTPPSIATPPAPVTVNAGNTATFAVGVSGSGPFSFQWRRNGVTIPGATAAAHTIASATPDDAGTYSVVVGNAAGSVTSAGAALSVTAPAPDVAPSITTGPTGVVVLPGATTTLAVAATGSAPLSYVWRRNGVVVDGATASLLTLTGIGAGQAGGYTVTVSNAAGSASSAAAQVLLVGTPLITAAPASTTGVEGGTVKFTVTAAGDAPRFQWLRNGVAIDGATSDSHTTPTLTLADSGAVYAVIVYNGAGLVTSGGAVLTVVEPPALTSVAGKLAIGRYHTCAVTAGNAVACWGENSSGQIGTGNTTSVYAPFVWSLPEPVRSVAAGFTMSCALTDTTGRVFCSGGLVNAQVPTEVPGLTGVTALAAGAVHACALKADGTVWCWGGGNQYELGNGNNLSSFTPVQVLADVGVPLAGVVAIDATERHTCAVVDIGEGAVHCWGANSDHQLGYSPFSGYAGDIGYARAVPGLSKVSQVVAGSGHTCVVMTLDSTVRCWGLNNWGQLGIGTTNTASEPQPPTAVPGLSGVGQLAAGINYTCALLLDGTVRCWGSGFLGNSYTEYQTSPVAVAGLADVIAIDTGDIHACVLRNGGSLQCWGSNVYGAYGNGNTVSSETPVAAGGSVAWWQP